MAKTVYNDHVREMHGAYTKDGTIHRRKTFRDSNGKVKGLGVNESYKIMNPRDAFIRTCLLREMKQSAAQTEQNTPQNAQN